MVDFANICAARLIIGRDNDHCIQFPALGSWSCVRVYRCDDADSVGELGAKKKNKHTCAKIEMNSIK